MLKFHLLSKDPPFIQQKPQNHPIKAAVFCNARDEVTMKEWASHHILLGFDHVIIFDHKSKVPLKQIFDQFDTRVTILNGSALQGKVKISFMNWALNIARKLNITHFIYLDADEYLVLQKNEFKHIHDFIKAYPMSSIGLNWLLFGSNFLKKTPKDPSLLLMDMYTKSDTHLNHHVKTLVKTDCVYEAKNPHYYDLYSNFFHYGFSNEEGKLVRLTKPYWRNPGLTIIEEAPAFIAHYLVQSEESFEQRKLGLPMDDTGGKRSIEDIQSIHKDHNDMDCFLLPELYSKSIKSFLNKPQDSKQTDCNFV